MSRVKGRYRLKTPGLRVCQFQLKQAGENRTGIGLELMIAKQSVNASGGTLTVVSSGCKLIHQFEKMAALRSGLETQRGVRGNSTTEQAWVKSAAHRPRLAEQ